ncbi:MAG TPA: DUF4012 domain-containing protein [Acidimicrobiia bacterium]|nr:DUF4012 domain-containing protein [Acidimicrobiia bacterium]
MDLLIRVVLAAAAFAMTFGLVTRRPRLLLTRGPAPVAALAVAAAAGALTAEGAPTAVPAVDSALRAVFAAALTVAAARADRQTWLVGSTATVVAGVGAPLDWLAFVATGATLAMLAVDRLSWIVGALVGACLAQVLLRLELGGTAGTSATVAGAIAGLMIVSGLRRVPRSTRRRVLVTAGAFAGAAVLFSVGAVIAAYGAEGEIRSGIDAGTGGLSAARRGEISEATGHFDRAADAFHRAGVDLGRWWVKPALGVPVVGHQLRTARKLSAAGENLASTASTASSELDLKSLRLEQGAVDLTVLDRVARTLASARRRLEQAAADVDSARSSWLLPPLVEAVRDVDGRVAEARRDIGVADEALRLAGPMLGRDGLRRWFVAVVTPAENRGSGGLVGNTGEITAERGKLRLVNVERIAQLNAAVDDEAAARVLPPVFAEAYSGWTVPATLQNATITPDFPTAAQALESVMPLAGRGQVDGTISIDPLAVAALLEAVGPVKVPSWPVPISRDNAAAVLLHEQYVALEGDARENFLGQVIDAVWRRATSGEVSPAALARALAPAVRGRHIQFHSRRPEEQAALGRLGADGAVRHSAGADHLALVTANASESKADWFLSRAVDYSVRYDPGSGSVEATVKVTLTNDAPASGLPAYVLGGRLAPPGANRQIVQLYTPFELASTTVNGRRPRPAALRSLGRPGNWAHELDVLVPSRSAITIELRLSGRLDAQRNRWVLDLGRQPAIRPDGVNVTLEVARGWTIDSSTGGLTGEGRAATARIELRRDTQLHVELRQR